MSLDILEREIDKQLVDIRSDKVTVRTKALESLHQIFDNRSKELIKLLGTKRGVTWTSLHRNLHEALKAQAERLDDPRCTTATKNRSGDYSTALMKCVDIANAQTQSITYDVLLETAFEAFADNATRKHCDLCYVQIIRKHVLKSRRNLATVKISQWSRLLSYLFELFERSEMPKLNVLECFPLLVQNGAKYTHLATDLYQYLPNLDNLVHQEHQIRAQHQVVMTVYEFVKNLAANHRISICKFSEDVLSPLIKLYNYRMDDATKLELFKILHLSIVVHHPRVGADETLTFNVATARSVPAINYVHDTQVWHKQLRNMLHIVESEIRENGKSVGRAQSAPKLRSTFVSMAADLCAVVFWDDSVWVLPVNEQQTKKRCGLRKLERLADLIERGDYAWQWATILSKLLADYPNLILAEDFQPLLQMLSDLQSKIKYSDQSKVFNALVRILVTEEERLKDKSAGISESFCTDHWHKIMQMALKNCATSNEAAEQNVELCRILIESGYIVSYAFIETITKEILSRTIKKSTASVRLLVSILQNVNMDLLTSGNETKASVIKWLSPKIAASELKQLLGTETDIDIPLIAELYVLCVLSKTDKSSKLSFEHKQPTKPQETTFEAIIGDLKRQFSYQFFDRLMAVECNREIDRLATAEARFDLPEAHLIDVVLNEHLFSELERSLNPDDNFQPTANTMDDFAIIASSLTTYVNILNQFLAYNAFDTARLEKSFLYKRIAIKVEQLNSIITRLGNCDDKDQFDVVEKLSLIWKFGLHPLVEQLVFKRECNCHLIDWLALRLQPKLPRLSQPLERISFADLPTARKLQLKCLVLVARFSTLDDENGVKALDVLDFEYDTNCNAILFIMFEVVQTILSRQSPEKTVQYALDFMLDVCVDLINYPEFLEQVIENIPNLAKLVHMSDSMQADLLQMVSGLITLTKTKLGSQATAQLVSTFKYLAQNFPLGESFIQMFSNLKHFAKSGDIRIQLEAIESLAYIFNHKWIHGQVAIDSGMQLTNILQNLYNAIHTNLPGISQTDDMDKQSSTLAIRAQLHCSIIAKCFCLRKENWFRLFELCCVDLQIRRDLIQKMVTEMCENEKIFHASPADALQQTVPYLIAKWIESNHNINLFPWYFTRSETYNDFLLDQCESITVAVLRYAPHMLAECVQTWHFESLDHMLREHESILINCLAYITPLNVVASDQPLNSDYKTSASKLAKILMESSPNFLQYFQSHSLEIVEQMLVNTWDETHFESMFNTRINYIAENHTITHKMFADSLVHIQNEYSGNRTDIFQHFFSAEPHRLVKLLYSLKLKLHETIFSEEKMRLLFHICILVDPISDMLCNANDRNRDSVEFFVRDLLHFFGNLITTSENVPELKLATCKYFLRFCKRILPAVAEYFKPYLNFVVSVLVPIIKKNDDETLAACAMELLVFLIEGQKGELRDAIAVLDRFPSQSTFTALCRVQDDIKYGGREFSLVEEIEYFLAVEKRKIEGLIALKEHLSTKKTELQQLFQSIYDVHGFSEDCERSIIHRLINSLLQIVQGVDPEKAMMAARCLGELGPSDLGTTVLKSDNDSKIYQKCTDFDEATTALYSTSMEMLNSLLLHSDARVLRAVENACVYLLQTNFGRINTGGRSYLNVFQMDGPEESLITQPDNAIALLPLFETDEKFKHTVWIKKFSILLLQQFGDKHLFEVASLQALFADAVLPSLIKMLLSIGASQYNDELGASVRMFFEKHFNSCEVNEPVDTEQIFCNKMIIKSMLNVAECIRVHNLNVRDRKIHLNYLHIAKAANFCDAHFTAILYGEMARMKQFDGVSYDCDDNRAKVIMKDSYQSIGEIDAVFAFIDPIKNRSEYLQLKQSWNEMYLRQDAISTTQPANTSAYAQTMCDSGLYSFAHILMQKTNDINYECAWRLGDWSVVERESERGQQKNNEIADECDKFHYFALKCLNRKDESGVKVNIDKARNQVIRRIKLSSYECTRNIYKNLTSLHLLQQIEEFCDIQFNVGDASVEMMVKKWNEQDAIAPSDFIYREPILAQRIRLFEAAGVRAKRKIENVSKESIPAMTLQMVSECREEGHLSLASRHLATINTAHLTKDMIPKYHIEDAQLNWALGDQLLAKQLIECVSNKKAATLSYLTSQRILGRYLAEIRSEETKKIIETQENSLKLLKNMKTSLDKLKDIPADKFHTFHAQHELETHQLIAKYADREFQQIADYKKSTAYEKKNANVNKNKGRLAEMAARSKSGEKPTKEEISSKIVLEKTINIDEKDIKATDMDYDYYLEYAIKSYLECIILEKDRCSSNGSHIFRVFSLWLANKSSPIANDTLAKYIDKVPSHKFIALMPQITTHLSSSHDIFYKLIKRIVERCAMDHPYHVLPQVFALAHANHDIESSKVVKAPRTVAAEALIHKLEKQKNLCQVIKQIREMNEILIKLANKTLNTKHLPENEPLCKLKDLHLVHCPTVKLPLSSDAKYPGNRLTTIVRWKTDLMMPGGINAPKRIKCICSNGHTYMQLLKGRDDLRQDAVMQQVFNMMNDMLSHSKTTRKLRLNVRTYIVVPLSQRSGILEWCENTIPLTEYLIGSERKQGAHERYFPNDHSPSQCRSKLAEIGKAKSKCELTLEEVFTEFDKICKKIHPVLHYFFYEKFFSPGVWFERRLAYAHSLATTSMIGYILGIGDRHVSNILIDQKTAELIHIDFGIAFEQGKCLPTPETIPFRLTRDLTSALGSTGIEGVFRKSCEKTMEVLRANKTTIITIIEVLLHDPLYSWTLTNKKAQKRQNPRDSVVVEDQDINGMAERTLLRLEEKLNGKHLSRSEANSVPCHVEILIREATNARNWSQLFVGWQAYL